MDVKIHGMSFDHAGKMREQASDTDLDLLPLLIRPRRVVGRGQHMDGLAVPDDAAEDPAERQEDLPCRVPGTWLACMASSSSATAAIEIRQQPRSVQMSVFCLRMAHPVTYLTMLE